MTEERFEPGPIFLLTSMLTVTFLSRMLLSPLLLQIRAHYELTHSQAGSLFLVISVGYSISVLLSGFVSQRLLHRNTVLLSVVVTGAAVAVLGFAPPAPIFMMALTLVGVGAGLYAPSGIAMLTDVVRSRDWGKALAIHEMGPILGFFAAPVLANVGLRFFGWRLPFLIVAAVSVLVAALFFRRARGGRIPGAPPSPRNVLAIWSIGRFWVIATFFVLAVGLEIGVYSMLPAFLVEERGIAEEFANTLVSISRLSALPLVFTSGWLADRIGSRALILTVAMVAGSATITIGIAGGVALSIAVLLQPMFVAAFFPAGLIELARVAPAERRNLTVSLVIPVANLFGAGAVPALLGYLAERGSFGAGFVAVGLLMPAATVLLKLLPDRR